MRGTRRKLDIAAYGGGLGRRTEPMREAAMAIGLIKRIRDCA